jgi:hypothetical protein
MEILQPIVLVEFVILLQRLYVHIIAGIVVMMILPDQTVLIGYPMGVLDVHLDKSVVNQ